MGLVLKSTAVSTSGASSITLPAGVAVGDLIVILVGTYNSTTTLTGYTQAYSGSGTGSPLDYGQLFWKVAVSGDIGSSPAPTGIATGYSGMAAMVFSGQDTTTPIVVAGLGQGSTSIAGASITTTKTSNRYAFFTQMSTNSTVPNFSGLTTGWTQLQTVAGSAGYHRVMLASSNTTLQAAGTYATPAVASDQTGNNIGIHFAVQQGNVAPTLSNISPANGTAVDNRTAPVVVSWTYSDVESDAQTQYEVGYRVNGSTGAFTTVTNSSANAFHSFATSTFTYGEEYELRVRANDGNSWGAYSTVIFTSGTNIWTYSPQVTSSSSSATIPIDFYSTDFEASNSLTVPIAWVNNNFFGTYTDCTFARTTTRPKTGSYSMEVTWPTGTVSRVVMGTSLNGFTINSPYLFQADVYVPTGSVNVFLDPFLTAGATGNVVTVKDQWVTVQCIFTAQFANIFFAFVTSSAPTSGMKMFVDNIKITELIPISGNYEVEVRTADLNGFGPWSGTSTTFVQRGPSNVFTNVSGTSKQSILYLNVGGVAKQIPPVSMKP